MARISNNFRFQAVLAFALVYFFWGSTFLGIKVAVDHIRPALMAGVRFTIAGGVMLLWCAARGKRIRVDGKALLKLAIIGTVLLCFSNVSMCMAETYIPSGLAALLVAITPLWFLLLERLIEGRERLGPRRLVGILLGLCGVVVLMWPNLRAGLHVGHRELIGAAWVMFSSFGWACGSMLARRWHLGLDPYMASAWQMLLGGVMDLLVALAVGDLHTTVWTRSSLLATAYLVVAGSWIGFTAYVWLLHNVQISKLSTYAYVNPMVAVFLGWLILHEHITRYILGGSIIVITSVILVTGSKRTAPSIATDDEETSELALLVEGGTD